MMDFHGLLDHLKNGGDKDRSLRYRLTEGDVSSLAAPDKEALESGLYTIRLGGKNITPLIPTLELANIFYNLFQVTGELDDARVVYWPEDDEGPVEVDMADLEPPFSMMAERFGEFLGNNLRNFEELTGGRLEKIDIIRDDDGNLDYLGMHFARPRD